MERKRRKPAKILISSLLRFNTTQSPSNEYFFSATRIYGGFPNVLLPATFQNNGCGCVAEYWNDMSIVFFTSCGNLPLFRECAHRPRRKFNLTVSRDASRELNINFYILLVLLNVLNTVQTSISKKFCTK